MRPSLTVTIADDHPVFRRGLRDVIESAEDLRVVCEAGDGATALRCVQEVRPNVVILDIEMPGLGGLEVAAALRELDLNVGIVFLTVYREGSLLERALELGVRGYVLKDCAAEDIVASVRAVAAGKYYASPELTTALVERHGAQEQARSGSGALDELTPSELRVLSLIAVYRTSKEIADELGVSRRTIDTHRTNICHKVGIHGSHALMKFALENKARLPATSVRV